MSRLNVNPTRMELKRLKARLKTATRGHKLLKDKTDEMVRRFSEIIKENKALREEVEKDVANALKEFGVARMFMSTAEIELAFSMPSKTVAVNCGLKNFMNVEVPELNIEERESDEKYPYSPIGVTCRADYSVELMNKIMPKLVKLAEVEKTMFMLSQEIERGKRRVNALEYVMIPQLNETIKYIQMKLDENERGSLTRLMKVKEMMKENT